MQGAPRVVARFQAAGDGADRTRITGHGVTWGLLNSYNRVFVPGTFHDWLPEFDDRHPVPIGWMHDIPVGRWDQIEEDTIGLLMSGLLSQTSLGNDTAALMRDGLNALSIGFYPTEVAWADAGVRMTFDTPYGQRSYQFDDYALYIIKAELVECSFVMTGADDEARVDEVQALIRHARELLPGVAEQASWEDTASSMARLLAGIDGLPELERHALYRSLTQSYSRHEKTPPPFTQARPVSEISFQHDERSLFAEQSLRDTFAAISQSARLLDRGLSDTAREEARQALAEVQSLLDHKSEEQVLAELTASLRETAQTFKEKTN
jgi:HK97 family phage prohead protease